MTPPAPHFFTRTEEPKEVLHTCRQGAAGSRANRGDPERRGTRESRAIPAPDANAELVVSMQVLFLFLIFCYYAGCSTNYQI